MSLENFYTLLNGINPLWLIVLGIIFLFIDLILLQTEAFLTLAFAFFIIALIKFLDVPIAIQIWSLPIVLLIAYFSQNRLFKLLIRQPDPYADDNQSVLGCFGTVRIIVSTDEAKGHFYQYKDSIHVENRTPLKSEVVKKIVLDNGKTYPARWQGDALNDGDKAKIVDFINGVCIVKEAQNGY